MFGPNGHERRIHISLPLVLLLRDDRTTRRRRHRRQHPEPLPCERRPRVSEKLIRRTLGKDGTHTAKLRDRVGYAATVRGIERGGV